MPDDSAATPGHGSAPPLPAGSRSPTSADYPYAPPQQPGGYAQAAGSQSAAPARRNGLGTASLVLGIVSLLTWLVPFVGVPVTVTCLCLGFAGRGRARRGDADNGGQATAGIVMGFVSIPLIIASAVIGAVLAV